MYATRIGLNKLREWRFDKDGYFSQIHNKFFKVIGVKVTSPFREVSSWSQPILDNEGTGIIGLLLKKGPDGMRFLMQAKADVGNRNIVQLGPTVQFNPGNYHDNVKLKKPFLFDEFLSSQEFLPVLENIHAEEGGRFYREGHIHKILILPDNRDLDLPRAYQWLSYAQLRFFLHLGDVVNSSARSILACLA
jgi:oxidase EvaA